MHRLLLLLAVLLVGNWFVHPAHAADQVLTVCDETRLNNALNAIQSDPASEGTITFDCAVKPFTLELSSPKAITGRITIDGAGQVVLSGQRLTRLFDVRPDASLTLRNIIIEKGDAGNTYGGAIEVNQNAGLALINSTIRQSRSNYSGGAIHSFQGNVYIESSILEDNSADYGGAVAQDQGTLVISGTQLLRNSAMVGDGGGVQAWFATSSFSRTEMSGNSAPNSNGGGFSLRGGTTRMQNVSAGANMAVSGGGIYLWEGGTLSATQLLLSQNEALQSGGGLFATESTLVVARSNVYGNKAATSGGGLVTFKSQSQLNESHIFANSSATGGGVFHSGGVLELTRSIVQLNSATNGDGGGIRSSSTLSLTNVLLARNSATQNGGALRLVGGKTTMINSTVYNNTGNGMNASSIFDGRIEMRNSVLARNLPNNCVGAISSLGNGYNLADDASCSELQAANDQKNVAIAFDEISIEFNTIETSLPVPKAGSSTLDTIPAAQCPGNDLRGLTRPQGSACDAGALERPANAVRIYQNYLPFITR